MTPNTPALDFSTILASTIHDMKNSLTMLLSRIDELDEQCSEENQEQLDLLRYEGKRVNDHLIQLLIFYRIEKTQYFANIVETDMEEFIDETLSQHQPLLAHHHIELEMHVEADLYWYVDNDLLTSIITNIMNNLYVYARSKIGIRIYSKDGYLYIEIKDDGPGYPEDMLYTSNHNPQQINFQSGSTGLGIYFASLAAKMHKNKGKTGFITTRNEGYEGGGCFTLAIP